MNRERTATNRMTTVFVEEWTARSQARSVHPLPPGVLGRQVRECPWDGPLGPCVPRPRARPIERNKNFPNEKIPASV